MSMTMDSSDCFEALINGSGLSPFEITDLSLLVIARIDVAVLGSPEASIAYLSEHVDLLEASDPDSFH